MYLSSLVSFLDHSLPAHSSIPRLNPGSHTMYAVHTGIFLETHLLMLPPIFRPSILKCTEQPLYVGLDWRMPTHTIFALPSLAHVTQLAHQPKKIQPFVSLTFFNTELESQVFFPFKINTIWRIDLPDPPDLRSPKVGQKQNSNQISVQQPRILFQTHS